MSTLTLRVATPADVDALIVLVNDAYEVESGSSGVSFKATKRIVHRCEVADVVDAGRVLICDDAPSGAGAPVLVGTVFWEVEGPCQGIGPLAVLPRMQGRGVARALLARVEEIGAAAGCRALHLETVDPWRTDLTAFYRKLRFAPIATAPFPYLERITRPSYFLIWRRAIGDGAPQTDGEARSLAHVLRVLLLPAPAPALREAHAEKDAACIREAAVMAAAAVDGSAAVACFSGFDGVLAGGKADAVADAVAAQLALPGRHAIVAEAGSGAQREAAAGALIYDISGPGCARILHGFETAPGALRALLAALEGFARANNRLRVEIAAPRTAALLSALASHGFAASEEGAPLHKVLGEAPLAVWPLA